MKFQKVVSSLLVAAVITTGSSISAFASEPNKEPIRTSFSESKELFAVDGELLGYLNKTTTVEQTTNSEGDFEYVYTEVEDYELEPKYAAIPEYSERFADNTEQKTYSVTSENELLVNGEVVTLEESDFPIMTLASDTGGIPSLSHYYSTSDLKSYGFATYSDVRWTGTQSVRADGNNVSKSGITRDNTFFYDAKSSIDSFEGNYGAYQTNITALLVSIAATVATLTTVIGLIAAGGTAAATAIATYDSWQDMEDDIADAYMFVDAM